MDLRTWAQIIEPRIEFSDLTKTLMDIGVP
jgi:hypothetical protein